MHLFFCKILETTGNQNQRLLCVRFAISAFKPSEWNSHQPMHAHATSSDRTKQFPVADNLGIGSTANAGC